MHRVILRNASIKRSKIPFSQSFCDFQIIKILPAHTSFTSQSKMRSTMVAVLLLATMAVLWETTQACSIGIKVLSRTDIKFSVKIYKPHNVIKGSLLLGRRGDEQSYETREDDCLGTYKLKFKGITGPDAYNYNRKFNRDGVLEVEVQTDKDGLLIVHDDFVPADLKQ